MTPHSGARCGSTRLRHRTCLCLASTALPWHLELEACGRKIMLYCALAGPARHTVTGLSYCSTSIAARSPHPSPSSPRPVHGSMTNRVTCWLASGVTDTGCKRLRRGAGAGAGTRGVGIPLPVLPPPPKKDSPQVKNSSDAGGDPRPTAHLCREQHQR